MEAAVTSLRSILEKPLTQLTEEDISQVTREECRKFLKEKGMRRPSWNKSQAIQQVICLKALYETSDDSGAGILRKILVSPPENTPRVTYSSADSLKESGSGVQISVPGDETGTYRQIDPPKSAELGSPPISDTNNRTISTSPGEANGFVGQMTIFYSGKVNVYDGIPPDKAQTIMHLAAGSIDSPRDDLFSGNSGHRSFPCHLHRTLDKHSLLPPNALITQTMQTDKMAEYSQQYPEKGNIHDLVGQANREVSLKRYREKRKDRGRFLKGKKTTGVTSLSMEMYANHQVRTNNSNGQSSRSSTSSPPQPGGVSHVLCSPARNQRNTTSLSVDLNHEDIIN